MADLAKLVVRLEAQSAQLLTELERANNKIDRFASQTSKTLQKWSGGLLAAFSARALINFGARVIDNQDKLGDLAQQAGVTVESISRLGYAAGQSGSDVESLNQGLGILSKTAVSAAGGGKEAAEAFAAMDINAQNADKSIKATDQLLLEIATSFSQHADGAEKSALAQQLFGKSGKELIPLLNKGAEGIEELTAKADALGITVSTQAQQAADDFNDSLATLGGVVQGVVGRALADVLPAFTHMAEEQAKAAGQAGALEGASKALAATLRLLLSAGTIVSEVFERVGDTLGALAAAAVAAATGNFSEAASILKDLDAQTAESGEAMAARLEAIWTSAGANAVQAAKDAQAEAEKALAGGKKGTFVLPSMRPDTEEIEKYYKKLEDLTATDLEKALASIDEQVAALDKLAQARRITDEQYVERLAVINAAREEALGIGQKEIEASETQQEQSLRAIDEQVAALARLSDAQKITTEQYAERLAVLNEARNEALGITDREQEAEERRQKLFEEGRSVYEATRTPLEQYEATLVRLNLLLQQGAIDQETYGRAVVEAQDGLDKASEKMSIFGEEARRNVQDILGKEISNAFKGTSDDILQTFSDLIIKLVSQALAAKLGEKLFGDGLAESGGGWLEKGLGFVAGLFGGKRDSGGRGQPGMAYAIGTGAQPEVYVPDQPGTFYPRGEIPGPRGSVQNIYVQGMADRHTARQMQLESARRQRIATARLG